MSQIVGLKVERIAEAAVLACAYFCANGLVLFLFVLKCLLVDFSYYHRCVQIAVWTLGFCYKLYHAVHYLLKFRVFVDCIYCSYGLEPLIHVAVVERRSVALAFLLAGCNHEVVVTVAFV